MENGIALPGTGEAIGFIRGFGKERTAVAGRPPHAPIIANITEDEMPRIVT